MGQPVGQAHPAKNPPGVGVHDHDRVASGVAKDGVGRINSSTRSTGAWYRASGSSNPAFLRAVIAFWTFFQATFWVIYRQAPSTSADPGTPPRPEAFSTARMTAFSMTAAAAAPMVETSPFFLPVERQKTVSPSYMVWIG